MHSLVHFYSLGKRTTAAKIFAWPTTWQKLQKIKFFWKSSGFGEEASGMVSRPSGSFWSLLEWFPKMPDKNWKIEVFGEETCSVKFFHAKFVLCNVYFVVFRIFLSWRRHRTAKWIQDGKALRVTRAVNNGWRFTARPKSKMTRRAFQSSRVIQAQGKWLVETAIAFSVEEQYFIGTTAGQIHFKSACGFSENFCTKSWISRGPVVRSWWKAVQLELRPCRLWFWKREVQENSVARERLASRFAKLSKFSEKCPLVRDISIFWALPGAHAPAGRKGKFWRCIYFFSETTSRLQWSLSKGSVDPQFWISNKCWTGCWFSRIFRNCFRYLFYF